MGERFEAGLVLKGTEVKSLRDGKVNLTDGWVEIVNGEAFLNDVQISHYSHGNIFNHVEKRARKLLLNKREIVKLEEESSQKGSTIVVTKMYFKGQVAKVEVAVAKAKKLHDKRASEAQRSANKDMARAVRAKNR